MNKKHREAKRKKAQAHQKKVKALSVQRENALAGRRELLPERRLFKADRVIDEAPKPPINSLNDVFGEFFAKHFKEGSGIPLTPGLESLMGMGRPFNEHPLIDTESTFSIIGRKCK